MRKIFSLLLSVLITTAICSCRNDTSEENYLGGKGELFIENNILQDNTNFYFGYEILKKFNKENKTLSVACQTPGCNHSDPTCKANIHQSRYCVFNGKLIKKTNESIINPDGTVFTQGYLYLCVENRQVFKNAYPDSFTDEDKKSHPCSIDVILALDHDNLAVVCSGFMYILDSDFNIRFTILDMGSYGGGIYSCDNEIYYINNLYRMMKLNKETGEATVVDLNSMKITEAVLYGDKLWFSNEDRSLCSYDFKTGAIEEQAENAVRLTLAGNLIEYLKPYYSENEENARSDIHLLNLNTGEDSRWELADSYIALFSFGGDFYSYDYTAEDRLTRYTADLSEISDVYTLED